MREVIIGQGWPCKYCGENTTYGNSHASCREHQADNGRRPMNRVQCWNKDGKLTFDNQCIHMYRLENEECIDHCKLDNRVCSEEGNNIACDMREVEDD